MSVRTVNCDSCGGSWSYEVADSGSYSRSMDAASAEHARMAFLPHGIESIVSEVFARHLDLAKHEIRQRVLALASEEAARVATQYSVPSMHHLRQTVKALVDWVRADPPNDDDEFVDQFGLSALHLVDRPLGHVNGKAFLGSYHQQGRNVVLSLSLEGARSQAAWSSGGGPRNVAPLTDMEIEAMRGAIASCVGIVEWGEPSYHGLRATLDLPVGPNVGQLYPRYGFDYRKDHPDVQWARLRKPPVGWRS